MSPEPDDRAHTSTARVGGTRRLGPRRTLIEHGPAAFRHRNFRLFWTGQLVSLVGTQMQRAAQAWLVLTLTDDPLMLGLLVTAQFGPVLCFGLFGGIVADALPKRLTLLFTQVVAMMLAFILGVLAASGTAEVWHVLVLAVLLGFTSVVDIPTRQTFVIEMVGRDDVVSAVALNSALLHTAKVIGPAIAGVTIGAFGVAVAFFVNGFSFVAVIGGLLAMRAAELTPAERSGLPRTLRQVFGNLGEGLRYVLRTPEILLTLSVMGFVSTAGMNFQVLLPPLARDVLGSGATGFGFLMAASGLGSITAALVIAYRGRPHPVGILVAALALGLIEVVLAFSRSMPFSLVCMGAIGLAAVAMTTNTNTLIQTVVPDRLRGRVMAVYVTVFVGSTPVGGLIFGGIAGAFGTAASVLVGGIVSAGVALVGLGIAWRTGLGEAPQVVGSEDGGPVVGRRDATG